MITLRPYQEAGIARVLAELSAGARSVCVVLPTGGGKGTMAAAILRRCVAKGNRAAFVVHRGEIMGDVGQRLARSGFSDLGFIKAGASRGSTTAPVQLCTVQTLVARGERPPADVIVWDECHHATAQTYRQVREAYPQAVHLGFTATPERADKSPLGDVFERLVVVATGPELLSQGFLVDCDTIAPERPLSGALAADPLEAWQAHADGRRTVLFAASVPQSQELARRFEAAGVRAAHIDGATSSAERNVILRGLASGDIRVVSNVYVLTEGVDVPSVEVCLLARGCGSAATFLQMVGRVLRPAPGKSRALLIDLRGVVHEHGLPFDERVFSLDGKAIRAKEKLPPIRQCKQCGAVYRPCPVCPRCGLEMPLPEPPKVQPTALVNAPPIVPRAVKQARFKALTEEAKAKGYKPIWIGIRFKQEFGHWPPWRVAS